MTRSVGVALASMLVAAGLVPTLTPVTGAAPAFWSAGILVASLAGAALALGREELPGRAIVGWTVVMWGTCLLALGFSENFSLASDEGRILLSLPAIFLLFCTFGASLALVGRGKGFAGLVRRDAYERQIGIRYLLSRSTQVLSAVTALSLFGVTLGVSLVIFCLAILAGFESDLETKIIGADAHLVLEDQRGAPVPETVLPEVAEMLKGEGAISAFARREVAVASFSNYKGAILFGVEPEAARRVLSVLESVPSMQLAALARKKGGIPGIVVGAEMAKSLSLEVGERLRVVVPDVEVLTPVGPVPKSRSFEVVGIFKSNMYDYDANYAYIGLPDARRLFELKDGDVTGFHVSLRNVQRSESVAERLLAGIDLPGLVARDWQGRNRTLVAALELERVVAFFVLTFVILVASFSVVSTLTMSVIEKRREIAILKTMGAPRDGILRIFLVQGLVIGLVGVVLGALLGVIGVGAVQSLGVWIPQDVYYIDALPVALSPEDVFLISMAALLIVWDFSVVPSLRGAGVHPVDGLRAA